MGCLSTERFFNLSISGFGLFEALISARPIDSPFGCNIFNKTTGILLSLPVCLKKAVESAIVLNLYLIVVSPSFEIISTILIDGGFCLLRRVVHASSLRLIVSCDDSLGHGLSEKVSFPLEDWHLYISADAAGEKNHSTMKIYLYLIPILPHNAPLTSRSCVDFLCQRS